MNKILVVAMALIAVASFSALGVSLVTASNSNQERLGTVPGGIAYQGYLTDLSGKPLANGRHELVFSLYDGASVSNSTWTETQSVVTTDGVFSTMLGANTALRTDIFEKLRDAHLGIAVDGDNEATPRQQLGSVPFAIVANTAGIAQDLDCTGCVTADHLAADAKSTGGSTTSSTTTLTSPNGNYQVRVTDSGVFIEGPDNDYSISLVDDTVTLGGTQARVRILSNDVEITATDAITVSADDDLLLAAKDRIDLDSDGETQFDIKTTFDLNALTIDIDSSGTTDIKAGSTADLDGSLVNLGNGACRPASGIGDAVAGGPNSTAGTIVSGSTSVFVC